ncbi:MAG: TolC family protein [Rickettsiales bacterium]|nr:TolC family protein [Rickettsiales bacterium]
MPKEWQAAKETNSKKESLKTFEVTEYNWWENFNDPVLNKIVKMAVKGNYDFKIAQSKVIEARANVLNATSDLAPKVDAVASGSRSNHYFNFFGSKNRIINFFYTGFDASWELDLFGGNYRSRQAAKALYEASNDTKNYILVSLIAEVVTNYSQIKAAQNDIVVEEKILKYCEEILKLSADRNNAGLLDNVDLERVKIDMINSKINLTDTKAKLKVLTGNLELLLGKKPNSMAKLLSESKDVPILNNGVILEAPLAILRNRPDVLSAEKELQAATELKGAAIAAIFPKVSLTSFLGFNSNKSGNVLQSSSQAFSVGGNISMPVLNFGGVIAGYKITKQREKQALLNYKAKVLAALHDTESSLSSFLKEEEKFDLSEEKFLLAKTISDLNKEKYVTGLISYNEYLNNEIDFLKVIKDSTNAKLGFATKTAALYKALGGGWQNLKQGQNKDSEGKKFKFKVS